VSGNARSSAGSSIQYASSWAMADNEAIYDLVAATLVSAPACSGTATSTSCMSGESAVLQKASVNAPPSFAARVAVSRSGLLPDCEMAMNNTPRRSDCAS
jgi:hypothetical protein